MTAPVDTRFTGRPARRAQVLLRAAAIVIAVAGLFDPAVPVTRRARALVAVLAADPARADDVRQAGALGDRLASDFRVLRHADPGARAWVLVGDGGTLPAFDIPEAVRVSALTTTPAAATPNVLVADVDAPRRAHVSATVDVTARVLARGMQGETSTIVLRVDGLEAARVAHRWATDQEMYVARLRFAPAATGVVVAAVEADPLGRERSRDDNVAETGIAIDAMPARVLVYEPRPSWASAFVRRALEQDARFSVAARSRVSRGIAVRDAAAPDAIDVASLRPFEVLVVGAPERLTGGEVDALLAFVRERGGALVLVPDAPLSGTARRLMGGMRAGEQAAAEPVALNATIPDGTLRASEWLVASAMPPLATVLAGMPSTQRQESGNTTATGAGATNAVVVRWPTGAGQILFSGALDAWRWRDRDDGGFDRFWRATIASMAGAVPPRIDVDVPSAIEVGDAVTVTVRVPGLAIQSSGETHDPGTVRAALVAPDGARESVRLWPAAEAGVFTGVFRAPDRAGARLLDVEHEGQDRARRSVPVVVREHLARPPATNGDALTVLASTHGGMAVGASERAALIDHLRRSIPARLDRQQAHPLRSVWWPVAFACCLGGEWWLRRRAGGR